MKDYKVVSQMTLMEAIKNQDITQIEQALKVRSALREVDKRGNTVLHAAVLTGNRKIVGIILDHSPKWEVNQAKQTPFDLARSLLGRQQADDRLKIAERVGRYFDATYNPVLEPITTPSEGCSRQYLKQTNELEKEFGGARLHAALVHHSRKTDNEKSRFVLADVHAELRQVLARMNQPKDGNIAAAAMTFELKIVRNDKRLFITIPIKVSGTSIFTISDALKLGHEKNIQVVLNALKAMHTAGKSAHGGHDHFHTPKYDNSAGDARFINHSEQPLYYYLKTEEGSTTLVNRLIAELRGKDLISFGEEIKVSNLAIHLHSTKTPCGPCETVIAGAQCLGEISEAFKSAFKSRSYVKTNKKTHPSTFSEPYRFSFPKKALRLVTTYSADSSDRHAPPKNNTLGWRDYRTMSEVELNTSIESNYKYVHVVKFEGKPPENDEEELSDFTIFSSASDVNKNVTKRKTEYKEVNDESLNDISESLACMKTIEKQEAEKSATGSPWSILFNPDARKNNGGTCSKIHGNQPKF